MHVWSLKRNHSYHEFKQHFMSTQVYSVAGMVIDVQTNQGVVNLHVEAWSVDQENRSTGSAETAEGGRFIICMDLIGQRLERPPSLYFKVYQNGELIENTENSVVLRDGSNDDVIISINLPSERPVGKDRLTASQAFRAADFLQMSDFKGVFNDAKAKAGSRFSLITDMITNTFTKLDIAPLRVGTTREKDVLNLPVKDATEKLAGANVTVHEVLPYNPRVNTESISNISAFPINLQAGQKVNLYEQDGNVKYYSIVKESRNITQVDIDKISEAHTAQLQRMQEELDQAKQNATQKDDQILKLQGQLTTLEQDHNQISGIIRSDAFLNLMKNSDISILKRYIKGTGKIDPPL